jgi:serine/tyrosine/threonine adenylyltransferase
MFAMGKNFHFFMSIGIPTSRAASLVVSDTKVERDPIYSGNVIYEKCAVVMRVAPSFFRFGSFEIFKEMDKYSGRKGPSTGLKDKMMP